MLVLFVLVSVVLLVLGGYLIGRDLFVWRTEIAERVAHLEGHLCGGPGDDDPDDPDEDELDPPEVGQQAPAAHHDVRLLN